MEHITFFHVENTQTNGSVSELIDKCYTKEYCNFSPIPISLDNEMYDLINGLLNFYNIVKTENNYIEYSIVSGINMKIDYLKNKEKMFFSEETIVMCLDNSSNPFYITDISLEEYKYKYFDIKNKLAVIKATRGCHFKLTKPYMYGQLKSETHSKLLIIRKWKENPYQIINNSKIYSFIRLPSHVVPTAEENIVAEDNTQIYDFESVDSYNLTIYIRNNTETENKDLAEPDSIITEKISFDDLLYKNILPDNIQTYINTHLLEHAFIMIEMKKKRDNIILEDKLKKDMEEIVNPKNNIIHNRFIQRLICKSFFKTEVCKWIIQETENHVIKNNGWKIKRHNKYSTVDININEITNIFSFVLSSFLSIWQNVKQFYNIHDEMEANIIDGFIVKYSENGQTGVDIHKDEGFLTFNILLNDNFEGGGTWFEDGVNVKLEIGDLLVHSGKISHSGKPITKGSRYVLVGFFNIIHKDK
jgi:hypothetical protein